MGKGSQKVYDGGAYPAFHGKYQDGQVDTQGIAPAEPGIVIVAVDLKYIDGVRNLRDQQQGQGNNAEGLVKDNFSHGVKVSCSNQRLSEL